MKIELDYDIGDEVWTVGLNNEPEFKKILKE